MKRTHARVLLATAAAMVAGCAESPTSPAASASLSLADAFATAAPGYDALSSSYSAAGATNTWVPGQLGAMMNRGGGPGGPGGRGGHGGPGGPRNLGPGFAGLMGGGLGGDFLGGSFGRGSGHGPFGGGAGCSGTFTAGRVNCADVTADGLTLTRSIAYTNAAGTAQAAFDTLTTNSVNVRTSVTGTRTFTADTGRGGRFGHGPGRGFGFLADSGVTVTSATTTVQSTSDRTVAGLAPGSTQRTVNGSSAGRESTTGTTSAGTFTTLRVMGDTTRGLVIPVVASGISYPTAGTVVRGMQATVTYSGQAARTASRREVITYNGTATATVVITENGTVRNCTLPLPRGRLTCS
jgi:hypothetical protein